MSEFGRLIERSFGSANPALPQVVGNINENPDQAARALELSRASGVPASAIFGDLDEFERQQKSQLASQIVQGNTHLADWVQSSPMVPKIANDDYGNLDTVSVRTSEMSLPMRVLRAPEALGKIMFGEGDPLERFKEGGPLGSWILGDDNIRKNYPLAGAIAAGVATPIEVLLRGLGGVQNIAADAASNLVGTVSPSLGRDLGAMVQSAGMTGRTGLIEHPIYKAVEAIGPIKHYIDNGREPPPGVHPEYDAFRAERNAKDVESLGEVVADAQQSLVRERNPDLFRDFIARHTDAEIGIGGDAIVALYGDKRPMPDDGLLGWVPGIAEQLELARKSGDDISVPLADWVTSVDPAVMKALADDIRVRPGSITAREAAIALEQNAAVPPPIPLPEELPAVRASSALEPMLSVGDRNIKMEKRATPMKADVFGADQWRLIDDKGNKIGHLELTPMGDKLYIDVIQGMNGLGPQDFGPALMRSLFRQIKENYPEAKQVGGFRISGAREKAGTEAEAWIKLDRLEEFDYNRFREVLEGGQWETYSPNIKGYVKPDFLRSEADRDLVNIVTEELDRIVPRKVAIQDVDTAKVEGQLEGQKADEAIQIGGAYIRYADAYPLILYALDSDNALGAARHEAIHHLRSYGFFKAAEWETLEAQALAGGWLSKYGIDRRYPEASPSLKLEEAIAEAYQDWAQGRAAAPTPEVHGLFERMKAFFTAIKDRISALLGKEATWEDVFTKVDTGEIGAREGKPLDARAFDQRAQVIDQPSPEKDPLPPAAPGFVRYYHGTAYKDAEGFTGKTFVTNDYRYARDYHGGPNNVLYTDIPKTELEARGLWDDANDRPLTLGSIDDGAALLKPVQAEAAVAKPSDAPPAEPSRIFERANALGMTIEQYKRYDKLIAQRHAEDVARAEKRIGDAQKRVQTKEWKANRAEMRAQVAEDINLRPDIAADNYFADGILYGEKVERVKLGTDFLTEEQRASLPRDYYNKAGAAPDDLAGLFGFPDGATLVQHLSGLTEIRRTSGMRPIEFKRRVIDIETDRLMQQKYGVLEDNIMDAVKDQVASETQVNILHEETLYYGMKAGEEPAFSKEDIQRLVGEEFEKSSVTSVNSDRYLAAAGRAGKAVENALLKQDYAGAFREKQRQFYSTVLAKEAIQFENAAAKFEKLSARLSKREVKAVEPEYLDFIHGLLLDAGANVRRTPDEVAQSKVYHGQSNLASFVESKALEGWDLAVSEAIANGQVKPLDQMSVAEMREFMDAVTSLNHVGRAVRKIEVAGEKKEFADFRAEVIRNITELPVRSRESQNKWLYKIDASLTRMEEIAKDLDLRKELGPLHQAVIEPMMRSKAKEFDLMTDLSKHFRETRGSFDGKWRKSLDDTINQDVLHDPYTNAPYDMTRQNLIQVMLNWGNRSNIGKYVNGAAMAKFGRRLTREEFPVYEAQIKALIDKHATAEDWAFVQRMWEPFKGWQEQMSDVSRATSGVAPKLIPIAEVQTPHGNFPGGYWPVKYDRLGSNAAVIADRRPVEEGVFSSDYFRAATAKGYLKERTGYVDFVDISTSLEQAAGTMQQTIHDIAFRDSLIQAGRVFYDKGIRAAIRKHYGAEYEAQLVPWLRRIAHQFSTDDSSIAGYNDFMRRVRINLVGHALPLNLKVILSPDIGVPNPKAWASYLANRSDNVKLAMEKSDEIRHLVYNMDRDFRESMDRVTLDPSVGDFQKKAVQWGFGPIAKVSQEFRISTFVDQYYKALGRGKSDTEASLIADSFVRERHGAASVVDLPSVMQSNEGMKMLTMFYGYFNTMYNWQRQLPGNVRRGEGKEFMVNGLGSVIVGAGFGAALFNNRKEDDSWFKIIGKALLLQPLSTIPVLNTSAAYFAEGYAPRTPIASLLGAAGSIVTDVKKLAKGERLKTMKPVQHGANVVGLSTGLPLGQVGRTGQFGVDVYTGQQRPKNITEWARGIITGEAKLKK